MNLAAEGMARRPLTGRFTGALRAHPAFALALVAYLTLAFLYGVVNPIHEATDEVRHYRFVRYLVNERALPVQDRLVAPNIQAHHPPLYYLTAALASFWVPTPDLDAEPPVNPYWAYRDFEVGADNKNLYVHGPDEAFPWQGPALASHLARLVTTMWGAVAVWATYLLGLEVFDNKAIAVGGTAFLAFNPQFLYLSGAVNNDVPAAAAGAVVLLLSVRMVRRGLGARRAAWLGLAYGAALLTKTHLLPMIGVIALALFIAAWRAREFRRGLAAFGIVVGVAALVSGWWFVHNLALYGEPTGFVRVTEIWGVRDPRASLTLALMELPFAWTTLWGRFGYGQIPLPGPFYSLMTVIGVAGLVGLAIRQVHRSFREARAHPGAVALLGAQAAGMALVLFFYILVSPAGAMGRFYFPGLPAYGLLVFVGLWTLVSRLFARLKRRGYPAEIPLAAVVNALMLGGAVWALAGCLAPAYAPPPVASAANHPSESITAAFDGVARLQGYALSAAEVRPGEPVFVTLQWEPLARTERPLSVFVHLLGVFDIPVAMRATYTGLGTYPTTLWEPGRAFVETYRVDVPATASSPDWLRVEVGLFDRATGARLPAAGDAADLNANGDAVVLGRVDIPPYPGYGRPYPEATPNPTRVNFGDRIALLGYDIFPPVVEPGRNCFVTLYWTAQRALAAESVEDLRVFLQAVGEDGEVYARFDGYPQQGMSLPSTWTPGDVIEDQRRIRFAPGTPPGFYRLQVGWVDQRNGPRLPIIAADGHWEGDALDLPRIRVVATAEEQQWWMTEGLKRSAAR